jgi:filamentous hemagglutinin family protein
MKTKLNRLALAMALGASAVGAAAQQLPTGGVISLGNGVISTSGNTMTVNQSSNILATNWQSFNIGSGNTVRFVQPNAASIALNRVTGTTASTINGSLQANGQVFLINPNGVLFGQTAQVNVGGLVATTLNIADSALTQTGLMRFTGNSTASVENQGSISNNPSNSNSVNASHIVLAARHVKNSGAIDFSGKIAMVAGSDFGITPNAANRGQYNQINLFQGSTQDSIKNLGNIFSNSDVNIRTSGSFENSDATILAGKTLAIDVALLQNNSNAYLAAGQYALIQADEINNYGEISSQSSATNNKLDIKSRNFYNAGLVITNSDLVVDSKNNLTNEGFIRGSISQYIDVGNRLFNNGGNIGSSLISKINVAGNFDNYLGNVRAGPDLSIIVGGNLNNTGAGAIGPTTQLGDKLKMIVAGNIYNRGIIMSGDTDITALSIKNDMWILVLGDGNLKLNIRANLENNNAIYGENVSINANNIIHNSASGTISANKKITMKANNITNYGLIGYDGQNSQLANNITLESTSQLNNYGIIRSADSLVVNAFQGAINNYGAAQMLGSNVAINADTVNNYGTIKGSTTARLNVNTLNDYFGSHIAGYAVNIDASNGISNAGVINSTGGNGSLVELKAGNSIFNSGTIGLNAQRSVVRAGRAIYNINTGIIGNKWGKAIVTGGYLYNAGRIVNWATETDGTGGGSTSSRGSLVGLSAAM